jgi:hypothetical protein
LSESERKPGLDICHLLVAGGLNPGFELLSLVLNRTPERVRVYRKPAGERKRTHSLLVDTVVDQAQLAMDRGCQLDTT